ncbi:hypothetical protein SEF58_09160 [Neomoorella humiferrea]
MRSIRGVGKFARRREYSGRADMAGVEELLRLVLPGFRLEKEKEMVQVG